MPTKTNVTNDPVSTESGNISQSQTNTTVTNNPVSGSGNERETENRIRENLRIEYARQSDELSNKLDEATERIEELEDEIELTKSQKSELGNLKDDRLLIEKQIRVLETNPEYRAYLTKIEREGEKVKQSAKSEAKNEILVEFMQDFLREEAKKEGIKYQELYSELNEMAADGRYATASPLQRAKFLIRDRAKEKDLLKREEEIKRKEAELSGFTEDGQRSVPEKSVVELEQSNDTIGWAKKLGL